jgi:alkanesulfonate monooxygenase SsuD/methylene tetrahydromethanopterin reductase-like flavin-dependent oxidoreductase (luciferase family)
MPLVQFGFCLPIFAAPGPNLFRTPGFAEVDAAACMAMGKRADELGYDSLWVADHLMLGRDDAILEGWTVLSALAGATSQAKLGMIHLAVLFRNPALTAKMVATLDQISGGRVIHFMDCGFSGREYIAYGLPWNEAIDERVTMLAEATELMLELWSSDEPVTFEGAHYSTQEALCNPKPIQRPHPPIWFGEVNPNTLDACAKFGQGWNTTPVSITELRRRLGLLREACERQNRGFDELELSLETQLLVAPDLDAIRARLRDLAALAETTADEQRGQVKGFVSSYATDEDFQAFISGASDAIPGRLAEDWVIGTPDQVEARLREYIAEGISHFMLWFMDAPNMAGLELFAEAVAPRFERVSRAGA